MAAGAEPAASMRDYLRDPEAIYARSFATIRAEVPLERFPPALHGLVLRLVHACGMPDIAQDLAWDGDPASAGRMALGTGAPVLADARMVAAGIMNARLPAGNEVLVTLDDPAVPALAARLGTTRSAAAVELWRPRLAGAVVAIGNAPTALFHLLEMMERTSARPAAVIGIPVGFVGAVESKEALAHNGFGLDWLVVHGRRGGSAITAAAVNAIATEQEIMG